MKQSGSAPSSSLPELPSGEVFGNGGDFDSRGFQRRVRAFGAVAGVAVSAISVLGCNSCSSPPEAKDPVVTVPSAEPSAAPTVDPAKTERMSGGCVIGGCSGERCDPEGMPPMATACLHKPEWDCYKEAQCGRNPQNQCDWVMTPELEKCLAVAGKQGSDIH